jgi:hypothetical protein
MFFQGDNLLLANDFLFGEYLFSTSLPANQWEMEVQSLFNISLTAYQAMISYHAAMPDVPITASTSLYDYIIKENTPDALQICNNQKFQTGVYYSFNIFGLVFILVVGLIVILVGYILPTTFCERRPRKHELTALEKIRRKGWKYDDLLFLDSIMSEAHGSGPWIREFEVPVPKDVHCRSLPPWIEEKGDVKGNDA